MKKGQKKSVFENLIQLDNDGVFKLKSTNVIIRNQGDLFYAEMKRKKDKIKREHNITRHNFCYQWVKYIQSSPNAKKIRKRTFKDYLNYFKPVAMLTITDKEQGRNINEFVSSVKRYLSDNYIYIGVVEKQAYYHFHVLVDKLPSDLIEVNRSFKIGSKHYTKMVLTSTRLEKFGLSQVSKINANMSYDYLVKYTQKGYSLPFYSHKIKRYREINKSELKDIDYVFFNHNNFNGIIFDKNIKKLFDK